MMTLHFHWLHAPRWLAYAHSNRAMTLVLGVIVVSFLFSALHVLDIAVSGALIDSRSHAVAMTPAASAAPAASDLLIGADPSRASVPVDASLVEMPEATVEAISL